MLSLNTEEIHNFHKNKHSEYFSYTLGEPGDPDMALIKGMVGASAE